MKKKGFTLIELIVLIVILGILFSIGLFIVSRIRNSDSETIRTTRTTQPEKTAETIGRSSYENKLRSASQIKIQEKLFSWAKHYDIYVEGEKVAEVTGKAIEFWGDVFTLKTADDKILASEKECKRFLELNRAAICYDGQGNVTGYLGEDRIRELFSLSYVFHFYDTNKIEVGKSKKLGKTALNIHKLYDNEGNVDYEIDKKFAFFADKYVLTRRDFESSIPLEHAVFIVCIEDAIADAHSSDDD